MTSSASVIPSAARDLGQAARFLAALALSALLSFHSSASAQSPSPRYALELLGATSFTEVIATSVKSQSGGSVSNRTLARTARFGLLLVGDTLVVSGDSLDLTETTDGMTRTFDAGGFVGGRWKLFLAAKGKARVLSRPFIPDDIAETSDVAAAMDDFFPLAPPTLLVGSAITDTARYRWERLADSSGLQRFRWNAIRQEGGGRVVADSVPLHLRQTTREEGMLVWDPRGMPLTWTRMIHSDLTTTIRGRTVQSALEQRIVVRRSPP